MIRSRLEIGREVEAVSENPDGVELRGRIRLHPGHPVDLVVRAPGAAPVARRALVLSWKVAALGSGGPIYRGACRWE